MTGSAGPKAVRLFAMALALVYGWACWAPSLVPLAKLWPKPAAAFAITVAGAGGAHAARCECPMDHGKGPCCCKHDEEQGAPEKGCAGLRACSHPASPSATPLPGMDPHAAASPWRSLPRLAAIPDVFRVIPPPSPNPDPADKVPI